MFNNSSYSPIKLFPIHNNTILRHRIKHKTKHTTTHTNIKKIKDGNIHLHFPTNTQCHKRIWNINVKIAFRCRNTITNLIKPRQHHNIPPHNKWEIYQLTFNKLLLLLLLLQRGVVWHKICYYNTSLQKMKKLDELKSVIFFVLSNFYYIWKECP
jgi:hypothetical protein